MKVERRTAEPVPPPIEVVITLTEDEANKLARLIGSIGKNEYSAIVGGWERGPFPKTFPNWIACQAFIQPLFFALDGAIR